MSSSKLTSARILSGVFLANEVDDERREVADGGGGIGFGVADRVLPESPFVEAVEFPMFIQPIKRKTASIKRYLIIFDWISN